MCNQKVIPPRIPKGFVHVKGHREEGFQIKEEPTDCCSSSVLTWVDTSSIYHNGSTDGNQFKSQIGCRKFAGTDCIPVCGHEEMKRIEKVMEAGGFYITTYPVSTGSLVSIEKARPITNITYKEAVKYVSKVPWGKHNDVEVSLPTVWEIDCFWQWRLQMGLPYSQIARDSSEWGSYKDSPQVYEPFITGMNQKNCAGNVYDVAGGVQIWTTAFLRCDAARQIVMGGHIRATGKDMPAAYKEWRHQDWYSSNCGMRAVMLLR